MRLTGTSVLYGKTYTATAGNLDPDPGPGLDAAYRNSVRLAVARRIMAVDPTAAETALADVIDVSFSEYEDEG